MNKLGIFNGARVLITGHTGFKGSWLSLWLSRLGAQVYGVSIGIPTTPSHAEAAGLTERLHDHRLDICDASALKTLIEEIQPDYS